MSDLNTPLEQMAHVAQAIPGLAPKIGAMMVEALSPLAELDAYLNGEMSEDEFTARVAKREEETNAKRLAEYGDEDSGPWEVTCDDCGREFTSYDWPELYVECSDIGEECEVQND